MLTSCKLSDSPWWMSRTDTFSFPFSLWGVKDLLHAKAKPSHAAIKILAMQFYCTTQATNTTVFEGWPVNYPRTQIFSTFLHHINHTVSYKQQSTIFTTKPYQEEDSKMYLTVLLQIIITGNSINKTDQQFKARDFICIRGKKDIYKTHMLFLINMAISTWSFELFLLI